MKKLYKLFSIGKVAIYVAFLATLAACNHANKQQGETEETAETAEATLSEITLTARQMQTVGISVGPMERRQIGSVVKANGQLNLDAESRAEVSPLTGGVVRSVTVREGTRVGAGQVVAYIENTDIVELQKNYLTAHAEALAAQEELSRQQLLTDQGAGVKKTLQQAASSHRVAKAQEAGLAQQLRQLGISTAAVLGGKMTTRIPVKAPLSGTVGQLKVSVGSYVDMQTSLMTIVNNDRLHCDLRVFEKDIPLLREGQAVTMQLTNNRSVSIEGRIEDINSAFDDDSRAVKVHVVFTRKPQAKLMPGMFVTGTIAVGEHATDALPDEAIVSMEGKKFVFMQTGATAEGTQFRPVEVTTGDSALGYTEVTPLQELKPDTKFAVKNAFYISSMLEGGDDED